MARTGPRWVPAGPSSTVSSLCLAHDEGREGGDGPNCTPPDQADPCSTPPDQADPAELRLTAPPHILVFLYTFLSTRIDTA